MSARTFHPGVSPNRRIHMTTDGRTHGGAPRSGLFLSSL
jgi:hypothetical protein